MGLPGWVGAIGRGLGANGTAAADDPTGDLVDEEAAPRDDCADEEATGDGCSMIKPIRQCVLACGKSGSPQVLMCLFNSKSHVTFFLRANLEVS